MTKTFEYITPKSETDPTYEDHEFLLCWYGRDGSFYQCLFTDWDNENEVKSIIINIDSDNPEALIENESRKVTLYGEDFTRNDLNVLAELFVCKFCFRLYKDGSFDQIVPDSNNVKYKQSDGRYNIEFDIFLRELALPK